jgi:hypothetical protein
MFVLPQGGSAAPPLVEASLTCDTELLSPGLSIRTETFVLPQVDGSVGA